MDPTGKVRILFEFHKPQAEVLDDSPPQSPVGTGLVYNERSLLHYCPVGSKHGNSECPERFTVCMEELRKNGLVDRCIPVEARPIIDEEFLSIHSPEYLDTLKKSSTMPPDELQNLAEKYQAVFLCNESFEIARLMAGGLIDLTEKVVKGELRNGFAVVRPPGHHAQRDKPDGYCLLNSVALAAKMARTRWNVDRVLIVDWDVHAGQGVQYLFEDDPSVLFFNIHRFGNHTYNPKLEDTNYDHVGIGPGLGYNVNVSWNKPGMGDAEYLAVFQHLLLPIASEFNPQLILVCAGYDAAIGDPQGEMLVSPACYAHMTHHLMGLAGGKVVLHLEGGYCLESLREGVAWSTKALLGDTCPPLPPMSDVCESALETLTHVTETHKPYWKCLQCNITATAAAEDPVQSAAVSSTTPEEPAPLGGADAGADPGGSHINGVGVVETVTEKLTKELTLSKPPHRTGLVYDERMKLHRTFNHPERPERIGRIYTKHQEHGLLQRCFRIQSRQATDEELSTCHKQKMIADIKETSKYTARQLIEKQDDFNVLKDSRDIYIHPDTYLSATVAAGCCFNLVDAVMSNQVQNAVGIVRPPGHHADSSVVSGFCIFNSVALASKYAINKYGVKRVLIVDWDVHHGNGTQRLFIDDPSVLYISLHRYDNGIFYPPGPEGAADQVGTGAGKGFNVNIGWNTNQRGCMGDAEYLAAFHHVIMPLAYQFSPELVFISAGFDAAKGDPLGGCLVSPEGYGRMTHMLTGLAGGRVITVLEGGYNLHSIAVSMAMCTRVMLGDPCPDLSPGIPSCIGMQAIYDAAKAHENLWPCMKTRVGLLETMVQIPEEDENSEATESSSSPGDAPGADTSSTSASASAARAVGHAEAAEVSSTQDGGSQGGVAQGADGASASQPCGEAKGPSDGAAGLDDLVAGVSQMGLEGKKEGAGAPSTPLPAGAASEADSQEDCNEDEALGACGLSEPAQGTKIKDIVSSLSEAFGTEVTMHAIIPQPWCPHLEPYVQPLPAQGLDVKMPCQSCGDKRENWVCLQCYQVFCGRYVNEHMLMHGLESSHLMVLSYADLSVWCYGCDAYIHNEVLLPAKRSAHISKFGEDVPGMF